MRRGGKLKRFTRSSNQCSKAEESKLRTADRPVNLVAFWDRLVEGAIIKIKGKSYRARSSKHHTISTEVSQPQAPTPAG